MKMMFLLVCFFYILPVSAQGNSIKNGNFQDSSFWKLSFYNGAQGKGSVADDAYRVLIENPGPESWNVQFYQPGITLDSGTCYRFSFDALSSVVRTIEASVCRDGGDYAPYSRRNGYNITPVKQTFESFFVMNFPDDTLTRVEFNCGKNKGDVVFTNVSLVKQQVPFLVMSKPVIGGIAYEGSPVRLTWLSSGISSVRVELSVDKGMSWIPVSDAVPDSGAYCWLPGKTYSPLCLIRISSVSDPAIYAVSEIFELSPRMELITNGTFVHGTDSWVFNVYNGESSGQVDSAGHYKIKISSTVSEPWQIQLTQSGIALSKGSEYMLSFTAYAAKKCTIQTDVVRHRSNFAGYLDSSQNRIVLTTEPKQYSFVFTIPDEDNPDARLDFNVGLAGADVYIDDVSLLKKLYAGVRTVSVAGRNAVQKNRVVIAERGRSVSMAGGAGVHIADLIGRRVPRSAFSNEQRSKQRASSLYIIHR